MAVAVALFFFIVTGRWFSKRASRRGAAPTGANSYTYMEQSPIFIGEWLPHIKPMKTQLTCYVRYMSYNKRVHSGF